MFNLLQKIYTRKPIYPLVIANEISSIGFYLIDIAFDLWVFETTRSGIWFSLFIIAQELPTTILSPLSGILADKYSRKKILLINYGFDILFSTILCILLYFNISQPIYVLFILVLYSIAGGLTGSAIDASIMLFIPASLASRIEFLGSVIDSGLYIIAILLGFYFYENISVLGILVITLGTIILGIAIVFPINFKHLEFDAVERDFPNLVLLRQAWQFVKSKFILKWLIIIDMGSSLVWAASCNLFFIFLLKFYGEDVYVISLVLTTVGYTLGQLIAIFIKNTRYRFRAVFWIDVGVGFILFTFSLWIQGMIGSLLLGFALYTLSGISENASETIWMSSVPTRMQGRVFGLLGLNSGLFELIGILLSGVLYDKLIKPLNSQSMALTYQWISYLFMITPVLYFYFRGKAFCLGIVGRSRR